MSVDPLGWMKQSIGEFAEYLGRFGYDGTQARLHDAVRLLDSELAERERQGTIGSLLSHERAIQNLIDGNQPQES
jgi:hypothetical protein